MSIKDIIAVDFEISCGSTRTNSKFKPYTICSMGTYNGEDKTKILIRPPFNEYDEETSKIIKQRPEDTQASLTFFEYYQLNEFHKIFNRDHLLLFWSADSDLYFLSRTTQYWKLRVLKDFNFFDVQSVIDTILGRGGNTSLKYACQILGIIYNEHEPDEDARVTYEIYQYLTRTNSKEELLNIDREAFMEEIERRSRFYVIRDMDFKKATIEEMENLLNYRLVVVSEKELIDVIISDSSVDMFTTYITKGTLNRLTARLSKQMKLESTKVI